MLCLTATLLSACSSAPVNKGAAKFSTTVRETQEVIQEESGRLYKKGFADVASVLQHQASRADTADCFKILSASSQWGTAEPEMLFLGESVFSKDARAYIFVPPLLEENDLYPTPKETTDYKLFRVDSDAPGGTGIIRALEKAAGNPEYCVKLLRLEPGKTSRNHNTDYVVISATLLQASKATPPKAPETAKAPEATKAPETPKAPETAAPPKP